MTLNQEIHKLRGEHYHKFIDTRERQRYHVWVCRCGKIYAYGSINKSNNYGNKDYENNIADAWELWDELRDATTAMLISVDVVHEVRLFEIVANEDIFKYMIGSYEGKTAPEAICKSYIKYMENKNEVLEHIKIMADRDRAER